MRYAIIESGQCVNAIVASELFVSQHYPNSVPLPEGYGIGDYYDGETWTINPERLPQEESE